MVSSSGPPPFDPSGQPPEAARSGPRVGLLIAVVVGVVVLIAGVVGAVVLFSGGGSPERAVEDWERAWAEGDCEMYLRSTTERYREDELEPNDDDEVCEVFERSAQEWIDSPDFEHWRLAVVEVRDESDDRASVLADVETMYSIDDGSQDAAGEQWIFHLIRDDDDWRVDELEFPELPTSPE